MIEIIFLLGLLIGFFALDLIISSLFLWIAAKTLKLRVQDYTTALKTSLAAIIVSSVLAAFSMIPSLIGIELVSMLLLMLAAVVSIPVYIYLIKRFYDATWKDAILAFLIVFVLWFIVGVLLMIPVMMFGGVVLWQLGVFNAGGGGFGDDSYTAPIVSTGWSKLRPLSASIVYSFDGSFQTVFVNTVGTSINVTSVTLRETFSGESCENVNYNLDKVKAGDFFEVTASCPAKEKGEKYDLSITLEYDSSMGGITTSHLEEGRIKGAAESSTLKIEQTPDTMTSPRKPSETTSQPRPNEISTIGWNKLRPLSPSIVYESDGLYRTSFANAFGTSIKINSVTVEDTFTGEGCGSVKVNGKTLALGEVFVTAKPGEAFDVSALCPNKNAGDPYDLFITVDYNAVIGGITTEHREDGNIQGPVGG